MDGTRPSAPDLDLVVVGGCGHVGLPLALCFADVGCRVGIYDIDGHALEQVSGGQMPFREEGAAPLLRAALAANRLVFSREPALCARAAVVIMVIGTPIDEFLNPSTRLFDRVIEQLAPHLQDGTLVVLRSTVYPGVTDFVDERLRRAGRAVQVVFCPERVAEGHAIEEMRSLPQLIGANDEASYERAAELFSRLDVELVRVTRKEAELAKLLTNAWRYIRFAIANQFFEIAHAAGVDYTRVLHAVRYHYPRARDLPGPGFAAGPCLLKDTMQLAAFSPDHFPMGHAAMLINEGLPGYIIDTLDRRRKLSGRTVGILGMAFKGESDDARTSLAYKLKKLAAFKGARVLCTDPFVRDPELVALDEVIEKADCLIIAAPHDAYRSLPLNGHEVVDIWDCAGQGIRL
ncbi:MAG TPA: nucleotide sugar dehydrogenase [Candidatus Limnocylindrales bacterium]|nr:nucleotide sugar dehydrogenase [Candidatus Limnocylindrales bacterium]